MNLQIIKDLELIKEKLEEMKVKADKYDKLMTPKKPNNIDSTAGYCSNCKAVVLKIDNYCSKCAQKIDWS